MLVKNKKTYQLVNNTFTKLSHDIHGYENADNLILCLHGLGLNGRMFNEFIDQLPANYKAITLDFSGHGRSDALSKYFIDQYCAEAVVAINSIQFKHLICFGNGIGNLVACKLASAANTPVNAIISDFSTNDLEGFLLQTSIKKSDFESLLGMKKMTDQDKYFRYMVRNFVIEEDHLVPICDHQGLLHSELKSLENLKNIDSAITSVHCDCFIIKPQTIRIEDGLNTTNVPQKYRIEYSRCEIERILEWMHNQIPSEKTRLIGLLGINTGQLQDVM